MIISKKRFLILFITLFSLSACDSDENSPSKRKPTTEHRVETINASIQAVSHQQILSGTLEATTSMRLHNDEAGQITHIHYHEGDEVNQGDLLISLDNRIIKAELDKAIAQHQQARIDHQRIKKLLPKKLASEGEVARSLTSLHIAKADHELQQLRLDRSKITAPFDGVVSQRNNEPGDAVSARSHILSVIQADKLLVKVKVSTQWLTLINKGDMMQLSIDALGDEKINAKVERIHPALDASTRKGTVELTLETNSVQTRAGQLARVYFQSPPSQRLVIPAHAIHHDINGAYAYIINKESDDKTIVKKQYLIKGLQFSEWTEINSGIELNDEVIIKGFLGLRDDKSVSVINKAETDESITPAATKP